MKNNMIQMEENKKYQIDLEKSNLNQDWLIQEESTEPSLIEKIVFYTFLSVAVVYFSFHIALYLFRFVF